MRQISSRSHILLALGTLSLAVLLATPVASQPCDNAYNNQNGPQSLYINLHNCGTTCANQELPYLELIKDGLTGVRINPVTPVGAVPPHATFYTLNTDDPYLRGVFQIFGPENVLVLLDDGRDEGALAKPTPGNMGRKLRSLLEIHPEVRKIQFMNEPSNFSGITPEEYALDYLPRARAIIDEANRSRPATERIFLYSAGWFGNEDGVLETQRMIEAGALNLVDVVSAHIYRDRSADARDIAGDYKRLVRGKPVAVTETNYNRNGSGFYDTQQWWLCEAMAGMERILRQGLSATDRALQHNVFYTLREDSVRSFNVIGFPDLSSSFFQPTGPGHFVLTERSARLTDPKTGGAPPPPIADPNACSLPLGHPSYCVRCGPCENGEGDCDGSSQCASGLTCMSNVGASFGFSPATDVCVGQADDGCALPAGHARYCTECGPCLEGQGDCEGGECASGLRCASNVGADFGFRPTTDVCLPQ